MFQRTSIKRQENSKQVIAARKLRRAVAAAVEPLEQRRMMAASIVVTPTTWNVVGIDSNKRLLITVRDLKTNQVTLRNYPVVKLT